MYEFLDVLQFTTASFKFNPSNLLLVRLVALGSLAPAPDTLIGADNAASLVIAVHGDGCNRDRIFPLGPFQTLPSRSIFPERLSTPLDLLWVNGELNSC